MVMLWILKGVGWLLVTAVAEGFTGALTREN
jgi:hypothetical protein